MHRVQRSMTAACVLLVTLLAIPVAWGQVLPVWGRVVTQDNEPLPDGYWVAVHAAGREEKVQCADGRFEVRLPRPRGRVRLELFDCAGKPITSGGVPVPRQAPGAANSVDMGTIKLSLPPVNRPMAMVVFSGRLTLPDGKPCPDGTEVAIALKGRGKLFDSVKSVQGTYSLALVDIVDQVKGFKTGDAFSIMVRLPASKGANEVKPGSYTLTNTDAHNMGVVRGLDLAVSGPTSASIR